MFLVRPKKQRQTQARTGTGPYAWLCRNYQLSSCSLKHFPCTVRPSTTKAFEARCSLAHLQKLLDSLWFVKAVLGAKKVKKSLKISHNVQSMVYSWFRFLEQNQIHSSALKAHLRRQHVSHFAQRHVGSAAAARTQQREPSCTVSVENSSAPGDSQVPWSHEPSRSRRSIEWLRDERSWDPP